MDWSRWIIGENLGTVQLTPLTPNRALVVRPEVPLSIPTNKEALFFVSFPIWVRITIFTSKQLNLCEIPSIVLSNTWFGDPTYGELCYSLRSRARRQITDADPQPHRAICPVRIRNAALTQLDVQRFSVRVEHLRIYYGPKQLWTNEIGITFKGEGEVSQVNYVEASPNFEPVQEVLSKARTPLKKPILKRSLSNFGLFTGA